MDGTSIRNFNTSHVSINHTWSGPLKVDATHFNTSHVSINQFTAKAPARTPAISIHLMFLLIDTITAQDRFGLDFNTSHVSINPGSRILSAKCLYISIHLMFLLIIVELNDVWDGEGFQYISCFY